MRLLPPRDRRPALRQAHRSLRPLHDIPAQRRPHGRSQSPHSRSTKGTHDRGAHAGQGPGTTNRPDTARPATAAAHPPNHGPGAQGRAHHLAHRPADPSQGLRGPLRQARQLQELYSPLPGRSHSQRPRSLLALYQPRRRRLPGRRRRRRPQKTLGRTQAAPQPARHHANSLRQSAAEPQINPRRCRSPDRGREGERPQATAPGRRHTRPRIRRRQREQQ